MCVLYINVLNHCYIVYGFAMIYVSAIINSNSFNTFGNTFLSVSKLGIATDTVVDISDGAASTTRR